MVHLCCGMPLQKAARNIAIIDMVICIIGATIRLILFNFQEYWEFCDNTAFLTADASGPTHVNISIGTNQIEELHGTVLKENAVGKDSWYKKEKLVLEFTTLEPIGKRSTNKPVPIDYSLKQKSILASFVATVIVGLVIFICYVILEIWLCRLLLGASSNRDTFLCKQWFWVRLTVTVFGLIVSIFGMVTLRNVWIEWALEPIMFYRAYELYVVNEFRKEIVATSGIVRQRV